MRTAVQSKKQNSLQATVGAIIERFHENEWQELGKMLLSSSDEFFPYHLSALKLYMEEKEKGNI